ncbi:tRNA(Ile)-lysidine synthetase [Geodermatophilus sp. Leaf369]|uniref:tRNA lysidine(34) synthetase TilS n=1 Tax=Geodermatophilus sp. Leaf369 TaxID=1736354 RepID=UPI0006FA8584|nr:tRNA lysidine(34) synthetase TilS [Geodermatophilus sp. Leaf369]KQS60483.1 tRNA(Ile)-lysidine synthetase [Geodermatophilus sp. Leaf369]
MGPDPAVAAVRSAVRPGLADGPVLVACSGGADSLALAAAVAFEAPRAGCAAGAVTVDHGLQPGSADQAARTAEQLRALGLTPVHVARVEVGTDGGPEGAARDARYAALRAVAAGHGARIALGHTRDDQAETVLLGLGRGSGPRSLAGMTERRDVFWRPLLGVDRATTVRACAAQGLTVWEDPWNTDPAYTRVRLRTEVLPLLEEVLGGGVAAALARTAAMVREDVDALDALAAAVPDPTDCTALAALPAALRRRALRDWLLGAGTGDLQAVHLHAVESLVTRWRGQGRVDLPGGAGVVRVSGRLVLQPGPPVVATPGPAPEPRTEEPAP